MSSLQVLCLPELVYYILLLHDFSFCVLFVPWNYTVFVVVEEKEKKKDDDEGEKVNRPRPSEDTGEGNEEIVKASQSLRKLGRLMMKRENEDEGEEEVEVDPPTH